MPGSPDRGTVTERRRRLRPANFLLTAALVAAVVVFATVPPQSLRTSPSPGGSRAPGLRGAFHIHTTRSDGAFDKEGVAHAAARAGLQFAIFTDHGDGTRAPDPPEYLHGVLCLDGVEISTNDGHYLAVGLPQAPYRLGGDGSAVAEDVSRLGGFGVAAHPFSRRAELAWTDWSVPVDGVEWLNADSEWRDESRIGVAHALSGYPWRPSGALASLLDRPVSALAKWDQLGATRRIVGLAGHDAHGGLGDESGNSAGRRFHVPSYEATFRTFSVHVALASPATGDASVDARMLLDGVRAGRVFTVVDAIAAPGSLSFTASVGDVTVPEGGQLPPGDGAAHFVARADVPAGATMVLVRDGRAIAEQSGGAMQHTATAPGAYRVEVRVPAAPGTPPVPWLLSNPIFRFASVPPAAAAASPVPVMRVADAAWHVESSHGSEASAEEQNGSIAFTYTLRPGPEASQFAALAADFSPPADASIVAFRARASAPMRVSAQLRFGADGGVRWRRSFYVDGTERDVQIPVAQLRPAEGSGARPPISRATSLLMVVDLTNAWPGTQGSFTLRDVMLAR